MKFLGLDLSTQGLTACVIDTNLGEITLQKSLNFGKDLPEYESPSGFIEGGENGKVHANPLMWVEAIDKLLGSLAGEIDFSEIDGISGSGQQHATVYLNEKFEEALTKVDGKLVDNLKDTLSRQTSPIWMDISTSKECDEMTKALGGEKAVLAKTGSVMIERFSASQIRKFFKEEPQAYEQTKYIHLASSFICSILVGKTCPIDYGDGAGMNLMNMTSFEYDEDMLNACAPNLKEKMAKLVPSNSVCGSISKYFVDKYNFKEGTKVVAFSGDNPNSLIGMGAYKAGTAVISLGTSDTYFAASDEYMPDDNGYGHIFGNPAGGYMQLLCFRNGSLSREYVKEKLNLSWEVFDNAYYKYTPSLDEVCVPFVVDEITPKASGVLKLNGDENPQQAVANLLEGQFMNMKAHTSLSPSNIRLTGGASKAEAMAQIVADVFGVDVERISVSNSAALGAAMRAGNGAKNVDFAELSEQFCKATDEHFIKADLTKTQYFEKKIKEYKLKLKAYYFNSKIDDKKS